MGILKLFDWSSNLMKIGSLVIEFRSICYLLILIKTFTNVHSIGARYKILMAILQSSELAVGIIRGKAPPSTRRPRQKNLCLRKSSQRRKAEKAALLTCVR